MGRQGDVDLRQRVQKRCHDEEGLELQGVQRSRPGRRSRDAGNRRRRTGRPSLCLGQVDPETLRLVMGLAQIVLENRIEAILSAAGFDAVTLDRPSNSP